MVDERKRVREFSDVFEGPLRGDERVDRYSFQSECKLQDDYRPKEWLDIVYREESRAAGE